MLGAAAAAAAAAAVVHKVPASVAEAAKTWLFLTCGTEGGEGGVWNMGEELTWSMSVWAGREGRRQRGERQGYEGEAEELVC